MTLEILGAGLSRDGTKVRVTARVSMLGQVEIEFDVPKFLQQADLLAQYAEKIRAMRR